jgi:hypothetical protein
MSAVTRWDMRAKADGCYETPSADGAWVRYDDYQKLRAAIERVRALHSPYTGSGIKGGWCMADNQLHPCPTIRTLDGEGT